MSIIKRKKLNNRRIFFLASLTLCVMFSIGLAKEIINRHQIDQQIENLEREADRLTEENREIGALLDSWSSSNQLEKEARIKLGLQKPGEKVVIVVREEQASSSRQAVEADYRKKGNSIVAVTKTNFNPLNWWKYFFN